VGEDAAGDAKEPSIRSEGQLAAGEPDGTDQAAPAGPLVHVEQFVHVQATSPGEELALRVRGQCGLEAADLPDHGDAERDGIDLQKVHKIGAVSSAGRGIQGEIGDVQADLAQVHGRGSGDAPLDAVEIRRSVEIRRANRQEFLSRREGGHG
jgi:hypothetical protein